MHPNIKQVITLPHEAFVKWPIFTPTEEAAVLRIMRDGNVSTHPVIQELEEDFRQFAGRTYALAHCNGTAALLVIPRTRVRAWRRGPGSHRHLLGLGPADDLVRLGAGVL